MIRRLAEEVVADEPRARVDIEVEETYRNMRQVLDRHPDVVAAAEEAIRRSGVEPKHTIIRGGTDGARLSARGLPTPNLFTGGQDYHSVREWASVQDMAAAAATVVELVRLWSEEGRASRPDGLTDRPYRASTLASVCTPQPSHSWPKRRISFTIGSSARPLPVSSYSTRGGDSA